MVNTNIQLVQQQLAQQEKECHRIEARVAAMEENSRATREDGGSFGHLHKLLSIESSSQVLYVRDRIYGDLLSDVKVKRWRTILVVPEVKREAELLHELRDTRKQLRLLKKELNHIEDKMIRFELYRL
ncbi:Purine 5'-nucleotidase [Quillaja saponaria]|uniref:Purine 5'-nucleotidase n=1 Tax=Quillaja saponaria TaxID=32244 RepID=A0AAD7LHI5_QUISA|nr:Purine 5'-nucleotidase [Quillaja saponaria]